GLACAGVVQSAGGLGDPGKPADLHRAEARRGGAIAELSVGVVAPAPEGAIGRTRAGVVPAEGGLADPGEPADLHRTVALREAGAIADLPVSVSAPAPEGAVGLARASVGISQFPP